jgi:prepilin-type processing-associated H-X9-DG protein
VYRLSNPTTLQAHADYAINGGDYLQWHYNGPVNLAVGDKSTYGWPDMSLQTGVSHLRSEVSIRQVTDGMSKTFLIGEKYINPDMYSDSEDPGDNETMYCADELDLIRWTGVNGGIGNLPSQDTPGVVASQTFGSAHVGACNFAFCDGSVRAISYDIDSQTYRSLGNREDGLTLNGAY